jgi:hypothetical protein
MTMKPSMFASANKEYCDTDYSGGEFQDFRDVGKGVFTALALLSMTASIYVALMIFYTPKLRQHPSTLIGFICLCEALGCFNALVGVINEKDFICYFGLHVIMSKSSFGL